MAGYSQRPLLKKLGIKSGFKMAVIHPPSDYFKKLDPMPELVILLKKPVPGMDFIHFFTKNRKEYEKSLAELKKALAPAGMIWVSWPKAASEVVTDMNERVVRDFALKSGLVDIKVCAVDETWSGLKLVIPVKNRRE